MFRRGLCLVLALLVVSAHLPMHALCAASRIDAEEEVPGLPPPASACPCNPTAAKCECCCSENQPSPGKSSGISMRPCSCGSQAALSVAPETFFVDPPSLASSFDQPLGEPVLDHSSLYRSIDRSPDDPPPR